MVYIEDERDTTQSLPWDNPQEENIFKAVNNHMRYYCLDNSKFYKESYCDNFTLDEEGEEDTDDSYEDDIADEEMNAELLDNNKFGYF